MAVARSSFGKRGASAAARSYARARPQGSVPPGQSEPAFDSLSLASVKALLLGDLGFADFKAQRAAWIMGSILGLMAMTVVLLFGFGFGSLMRAHNMMAEVISGFVLFATAGLAMLAAVYGGSLLAEQGKRHDLRFAILLLVFAVELMLFLAGETLGKPKGVSWLLFGAVVAGLGLWMRLRYDRLLAHVAELTGETEEA
jgi:hypothetical protein